jgi:VanZ family protein
MVETNKPATPRQKVLRWALWWLTLALWTGVLVSPQAPSVVASVVPSEFRFPVAKVGHVAGYTVLSLLVGFLPVRMAFKVVCWLFLVFHACLTEYIQLHVPGRTGSLRDVGLDVLGVTLGLTVLALWKVLRPR